MEKSWDMSEFFVGAKFQGRGVAREVARHVFHGRKENWQVDILPQNTPALKFWEKTINEYAHGKYSCEVKRVPDDEEVPRVVFNFSCRSLAYTES